MCGTTETDTAREGRSCSTFPGWYSHWLSWGAEMLTRVGSSDSSNNSSSNSPSESSAISSIMNRVRALSLLVGLACVLRVSSRPSMTTCRRDISSDFCWEYFSLSSSPSARTMDSTICRTSAWSCIQSLPGHSDTVIARLRR